MKIILSEERQLDAYNKVVAKLREMFYKNTRLQFKMATLKDKLGFVGNIIQWKSNGKSGWFKMEDFLNETDIPRIFKFDEVDLHQFKKAFRSTEGDEIDLYELATIIMKAKTIVGHKKSNDF